MLYVFDVYNFFEFVIQVDITSLFMLCGPENGILSEIYVSIRYDHHLVRFDTDQTRLPFIPTSLLQALADRTNTEM